MTPKANEAAPTTWFESPDPAVLVLPHLITALDAELIGKVTQLTKSKPGIWNVPAPFDEYDGFDNMRETAPLSAWALPLNQGEVQSFGPLVTESVFGVKLMFVDAAADERLLIEHAVCAGRRLPTGAYVTQGYQDLATLPHVLERIGWVLIPLAPDASRALFATSAAKASWVAQLREWCEREGRNFFTARRKGREWTCVEHLAPAKYRENAIAHRIDGFLGDFAVYFGAVDESLLATIEERICERRKLQKEVARLKGAARRAQP